MLETDGYDQAVLTGAQVADETQVDLDSGLTFAEAERRLARDGANRLPEKPPRSALLVLLDQFKSVLILVLLASALIAGALGDLKDALVIIAIVALNAVIGFMQEERAEKAIHALRKLTAPSATVLREGRLRVIKAEEVVRGDLLHIESGDLIAADAKIVKCHGLHTQEAMLTGESMPVEKGPEGAGSMVFMGTVAVKGHGVAIAVETGPRTRLGQIAGLLDSQGFDPTPLQRRLARFASHIAIAAIVVAFVVFILGTLRGESIFTMFLTALSLLVAAVPEALPAVVTLGLALGAQRMVKRQAIIRKLPAAETLGSVTVICTDKTGTLTRNRMMVEAVATAGQDYQVTGDPDAPGGDVVEAGAGVAYEHGDRADKALLTLLDAAVLCNNAELTASEDGRWEMVGDPMEAALLVLAAKAEVDRTSVLKSHTLVTELPFDSSSKTMSTTHRRTAPETGDELVTYTKGAFEQVLAGCDSVLSPDGHRLPLYEEERTLLGVRAEKMAGGGLRVLGFATSSCFLGFVGFLDPPRPESERSVALCRSAGIRPVMITGDHPLTAGNIATRVGILRSGDRVMTGTELGELTPDELRSVIGDISVFARTSPEQKVKIVEAYKAKGEIVAMTGDGVNDAPALRRADIGVAMGISGTEVSKEAADMVLADDNFATIVAAVAEGRRIYDNVRRFVRYILSTNSAEIFLLISAPALGMPLPLLPIHLLWLNLVTDGLPGLALGVELAEKDVMDRPPRDPQEQIMGRGLWQYALWSGLLIGLLALGLMTWAIATDEPAWQTLVFTSLCFMELGHAMGVRSMRESLWKRGLRSNLFLVGAVIGTVILQLCVVYLPPLQAIFDTESLSLSQLSIAFALPLVVLGVIELEKWVRRLRTPAYSAAAPAR